MKRDSKKVPLGLSPLDCLRFWGFEENKVTRGLFYLTKNYERLFEGRIIAVTLAKKWIMNVFKSGARKVAGGELNENNRMGEVQGVSLQYFPVVETNPGDMFVNNELAFCNLIVRDIDDWLSSRPLPEGHIRLFHGTSTRSMNEILEHGIDPESSEKIGDFGAGFYCADTLRTALRFAILSALLEGFGRRSVSLIYFDVKNDDLGELNQIEVEGADWTEFTGQCLSGKKRDAYVGERSALQLMKGKVVRNPHQVELDGLTPQAFEDQRKQYAFREKAGNLLLENKGKMGVALFDVYMLEEEDEA
jgi:hypothetical protein